MTIDPSLYEKYSGRKGDPYTRMGEALAKNAKHKQERDALPKGVSGGFRIMMLPHWLGNLFFFWRANDKSRFK